MKYPRHSSLTPWALVLFLSAAALEAAEPEWGVAAGYGFAVRFSGRAGTNEQVLLFAPSAAWQLSSRLEYVVEGHFAQYFAPAGYMVGAVPLGLRFSFGSGALRPYVAMGAGAGWTNLDKLPEIDRRFNFILQAGAGLRGALANGQAWTFEARLSHYSNANTEAPNISLNCVVFLAGWRF